jgi:hypothetical protein
MPTFVYRDGRMVDKRTGEPMNAEPVVGAFPCPQAIHDMEPYASPIDGRYIGGRRSRAEDLKRNDCVDARDLPGMGGVLKNKRFAEKKGLTHRLAEDAQ